jgi:hypothetical protein
MSLRRRRIGLAAASVILALACSKKAQERDTAPAPPPPAPPPPAAAGIQVSEVQLGTAIGDDKRVTAPTEAFKPTDTIYVSIATAGSAPKATLTSRVTFEDGQVVDESSQEVSGAGVTEFHLSKPDGWPAGRYSVEVLLDGKSVSTRSFAVS